MSSFKDKLVKFWYFTFRNPVVRDGEKGGFKWRFRRFWLEISTLSGNFQACFTAAAHPFGYLLSSKDDSGNIEGFCQTLYTVGMLLTTDQQFVDDIQGAIARYEERTSADNPPVEDEVEEESALEEVKAAQALEDLPRKARKALEKRTKETLRAIVAEENEKNLEGK